MRAMQANFHNLFFPLLFILVQGSIRKELVRKLDVFATTSNSFTIYIILQFNEIFFKDSTIALLSNDFIASRVNMENTRNNMGITTQGDKKNEHTFPPGCTIGPTMNQYRGKVDFLNRSQSPYVHLALLGLKTSRISILSQGPFGAIFTRIFILYHIQEFSITTRYGMTSRGPYTLPFFFPPLSMRGDSTLLRSN